MPRRKTIGHRDRYSAAVAVVERRSCRATSVPSANRGVGLLDERDQLGGGSAVLLFDLVGVVGLHPVQQGSQAVVTAVEGMQWAHPLRGSAGTVAVLAGTAATTVAVRKLHR